MDSIPPPLVRLPKLQRMRILYAWNCLKLLGDGIRQDGMIFIRIGMSTSETTMYIMACDYPVRSFSFIAVCL